MSRHTHRLVSTAKQWESDRDRLALLQMKNLVRWERLKNAMPWFVVGLLVTMIFVMSRIGHAAGSFVWDDSDVWQEEQLFNNRIRDLEERQEEAERKQERIQEQVDRQERATRQQWENAEQYRREHLFDDSYGR